MYIYCCDINAVSPTFSKRICKKKASTCIRFKTSLNITQKNNRIIHIRLYKWSRVKP